MDGSNEIMLLIFLSMFYYYRQGVKCSFDCTEEMNGLVFRKVIPECSIDRKKGMRIGPKRYLYLLVMTFLFAGFKRVFSEYRLERIDGKLLSRGVVMSYVPMYKFMPHNGVHLGYCITVEDERGKGYYSLLLKMIQNDIPHQDLYMAVDENNIASIKGIENAGFVRYSKGIRKGKVFLDEKE